MSPKIRVLWMSHGQAAQSWMQTQANGTLFIPMQPLALLNHPHILPLDYFFNDDDHDPYDRFSMLLQSLTSHAPSGMTESTIALIAQDLHCHIHGPYGESSSIQWIQTAIYDHLKQPVITAYYQNFQARLQEIATWINTHYRGTIFYGMNDHLAHQIRPMIHALNGPVSWVIPHVTDGESTLSIDDLLATYDDHRLAPLPPPAQQNAEHTVSVFASLDQEINAALTILDQRSGHSALVVPTSTMLNRVRLQANQSNISIDSESMTPLGTTAWGQLLHRMLDVWTNPTFDSIKALVYSPGIPDASSLIAIIQSLAPHIGITIHESTAVHRFFDQLPDDHPMQALRDRSSIQSVITAFTHYAVDYATSSDNHQSFKVYELVAHIVKSSESYPHPDQYIRYQLAHQYPPHRPSNARIIGLLPESLGRYLDYPIWVMGLGHLSWNMVPPQHYLNTDQIGLRDSATALRWGLASWAMTHPHLIGASYSQQIDGTNNPPPEAIRLTPHFIPASNDSHPPFQRRPRDPISPPSHPQVSVSNLQLYQQCPYAFYLSHILTLPDTSAQTDHQIMGIMIHRLIETMIHHPTDNPTEAWNRQNHSLTPLWQRVVLTRMAKEWPITDLLTLCQKGTTQTEVSHTITHQQLTIRGRMDIHIQSETGIDIIDIKTGTRPAKLSVQSLDDIQLGLYVYMARQATPIRTHFFTKHNELKAMISSENPSKDPLITTISTRLDELATGIQSGDFLPHHHRVSQAKHTDTCRHCRFRGICFDKDRHPE